jgi:hypothetical protein
LYTIYYHSFEVVEGMPESQISSISLTFNITLGARIPAAGSIEASSLLEEILLCAISNKDPPCRHKRMSGARNT